jgi:hypothetical protein
MQSVKQIIFRESRMTDSNASRLTFDHWRHWAASASDRAEASRQGNFSKNLKLSSKTLIFDNMRHIYGPMIVGIGKSQSKRRTLWFLDVSKENRYEQELRDKSRVWAVMRMEFVEARSAHHQTDNLGLYDGLSVSEHFIQRIFKRNCIESRSEFARVIQEIMVGIVRLDTKNLAEDFLAAGCANIGLISELGVFFVLLEKINASGRMVLKTFISFDDMTNTKKTKLLTILRESSLHKSSSVRARFAVISASPEGGAYETYDDFVKSYVTSDKYTPPKAPLQSPTS